MIKNVYAVFTKKIYKVMLTRILREQPY